MKFHFFIPDYGYCSIMRCIKPAIVLQKIGHEATFSIAGQETIDILNYDIFIMLRPFYMFDYENMKKIQFLGKKAITNVDDLHESMTFDNPMKKLHEANPQWIQIHQRCCKEADMVICSTDFLANYYKRYNPHRTVVFKNGFLNESWDGLEKQYIEKRKEVRIGWTGTLNHQENLKIVIPVLTELSKLENIKIVFFGDCPEEIKRSIASDKLIYKKGIGFDREDSLPDLRQFPRELAELDIDILLRPLQSNDFNNSKSLQTYMNGALLKIPVIVSDIIAHKEIPDDCCIKVSNNSKDWRNAIIRLIENYDERKMIGENGYNFIKQNHDLEKNIPELLELMNLMNNFKIKKSKHISNSHKVCAILNDLKNGDDGSEEFLNQYENVKIIKNQENLSFSKAYNEAVKSNGESDFILILNNDIIPITEDWIEKMKEYFTDPSIGIVGVKLLYPHGRIQHCGVVFNRDKLPYHLFYNIGDDLDAVENIIEYEENSKNQIKLLNSLRTYDKQLHEILIQNRNFGQINSQINMMKEEALKGKLSKAVFDYADKPREYQAVTAACMMVRAKLWKELGGFSEDYEFNYEDVDLSMRVKKAGYKTVYAGDIELTHIECGSGNKPHSLLRNLKIFINKWGKDIIQDDMKYVSDNNYNLYKKPEKLEPIGDRVLVLTLSRKGIHFLRNLIPAICNQKSQ